MNAFTIAQRSLQRRPATAISTTVVGRVVDPGEHLDVSLEVTIEDGVITGLEPATDTTLLIAPAFVDPHVHLRTPGREDEETIASGTSAAAAGGYCAILAMPNTDPVVDNAAVLGSLIELAHQEALIPTGFMASITRGLRGEELTEMGELAALGAAGFTDDGHPVGSANVMRHALQYSAVAGLRLALHEEETTLTRDGHMHEGAVSAELGLGGWPSIGESLMIARDIALAAYEGQPIHVMHISCAESVELIRRAQRDGVGVTAEVSPHHLCLTDEAVRSLDTNTKMNPPLRSEADRQALIAGLLDGTISSIATDHAPHALHEKETPFEEAPFGVIGLETAFAVLWTRLIEPGHVPLETVLAAMSAGPARIFDLAVPRIAVGEPANIVAIDLAARWMVAADGIRSRSTNSWLLGATLLGKVVRTIADGVEVFAA